MGKTTGYVYIKKPRYLLSASRLLLLAVRTGLTRPSLRSVGSDPLLHGLPGQENKNDAAASFHVFQDTGSCQQAVIAAILKY